jgi:hypothetical protein
MATMVYIITSSAGSDVKECLLYGEWHPDSLQQQLLINS